VEENAKKIVKEVKREDVMFVARILAKHEIIRFVDYQVIEFHRPVYARAVKVLQDTTQSRNHRV